MDTNEVKALNGGFMTRTEAKAKAQRMLDAASRMAKKNLELSGVGIGGAYYKLASGIKKILNRYA